MDKEYGKDFYRNRGFLNHAGQSPNAYDEESTNKGSVIWDIIIIIINAGKVLEDR